MKTKFKKVAVVHIVLVLFCIAAVAQKEDNVRTMTGDSYGVDLLPSSDVVIEQEQSAIITIQPWEGFDLLCIDYNNNSYGEGTTITGENFTAVLTGYALTITANATGFTGNQPESLSVKVKMKDCDERLKMSRNHDGEAIITITVLPKKNIGKN